VSTFPSPAASRRDGSGPLLIRIGVYAFLVVLSAFMLLPFAWMLSSSLKPLAEIFDGKSFLPRHPTLINYVHFFQTPNAVRAIWNSFYITTTFTALSVFLCAAGGYAFAKFKFFGMRFLFAFVVASLAIPPIAILVPQFVMLRNTFHWIDTPWPLILPGAASAYGIFFMRQFMLSIPDEIIDAGRVDGASEPRIFLRLILPVARPAILSLAIIFYVAVWNAFLAPVVYLSSPVHFTLPVLIRGFQGDLGRTPYDVIMAGSVVSALPLVIGFLVFQRRLVSGIMEGTVKG
jgi:ABC-type glycerol-3-phosphate transport system permease component